jgi:hypothetical protein
MKDKIIRSEIIRVMCVKHGNYLCKQEAVKKILNYIKNQRDATWQYVY